MYFPESVLELIGDTPLVRLGRMASGLAPTLLAKLEQANPGGSSKDRIALRMVEDAEASGALRPGGVIVEPTSGNTGVGLALVAQQKGYRCVFTCPDKVAPEKIAVLRAYGAEVTVCPAAVPPDHPDSYRSVASRLAAEIPGAFEPNQYTNPANPASHYLGTGPEVWKQTEGRISHFVCGVGTGGTISGTGRYLKEISEGRVRVIGADPLGSVYSGGTGRPYLVEGVGQPSLPGAYDPSVPDEVIGISDRDSITHTHRLAREAGILTGGSGGMAVAAALQVAARCKPSDLIVVLIPDSGRGYVSKLFNDDWLARNGFVTPIGDGPRVRDVAPARLPIVPPDATVDSVMQRLADSTAGLLLVSAAPPPVRLAEIIGTVTETGLAERLARGRLRRSDPVARHVDEPPPLVGTDQLIVDAIDTINRAGAALVVDGGLPSALVTPRDVIALLDRPPSPEAPQ